MDYISLLAPAWTMGALLVFLTAPLGCLMLWRRMSFFADTMSHGTLLGVAISGLLALPYWVGVLGVSGLLVLILWALQDRRLPTDALLALCSSALLCSGLLLINNLPALRPELVGYLFGDLLALNWADLPILLVATIAGVATLAWNWKFQLRLAIDSDMAVSEGVHAGGQRLIFMLILALFTVLALKAVGTLLMGALLIIPALTARLWARSPYHMVGLAFVFAQIGITGGLWGSVWLNIATGASIVLVMVLVFGLLFLGQKVKGMRRVTQLIQ
jgi:zinc transport system permease protein